MCLVVQYERTLVLTMRCNRNISRTRENMLFIFIDLNANKVKTYKIIALTFRKAILSCLFVWTNLNTSSERI